MTRSTEVQAMNKRGFSLEDWTGLTEGFITLALGPSCVTLTTLGVVKCG